MPRFLPATGLRFRLMLLVVMAMLPMLGLLLYRAEENRARKLTDLQEEALRIGELSAGSVSQVIEGTRQLLFSVASSVFVLSAENADCSSLFAEHCRHSTYYHDIGVVHGTVGASAFPPAENPQEFGKYPWFEHLQSHRDFCVGEFQIDETTHKPILVLSYPLPGQAANQPVSAVYAALNLDSLQNCISRPKLVYESVIAVVDRKGILLARHPDAAKWVGYQARSWSIFKSTPKSRNKVIEVAGVDGIERYYRYIPVPGSDNGLFVIVGVPKAALAAVVKADYMQSLFWLGVFTLGALGCAWFVADFSVILHVKRLTVAAHRLAAGEWDTRARLKGGARELQQLAHAFDDMAAALREHRDRLEEQVEDRTRQLSRMNETLRERIAERMEAEAASNKLLNDLKRSNQELEQFAYVASHDLQEPLRLVSAYTQLLLQRYRGKLDADADPIVNFITEGVSRMQQLIQDLLTYSRVSSKTKPFCPENLEMPLKAALQNLSVTIRESQAVVTHDPLPTVMCNAPQLVQLFQNLIGNGLKFHGKTLPRIHVGVQKTDVTWLFSVRDNGIGIDPEYFERIFVIFQRLHTRAKYPGTGIGLAICKRIVEQHGGQIWVESEKGNGCTFFFTIPILSETL